MAFDFGSIIKDVASIISMILGLQKMAASGDHAEAKAAAEKLSTIHSLVSEHAAK